MRRAVAMILLAGALSACGDDDPGADPKTDDAGVSVGTSDVTTTVIDGGPVGVADVGGEAWTVLVEEGEVRTADDTRIPVGNAPLRLVDTPDGVWVSVIGDGTVVRIDPATGKVDQTITLEPEGSEPEGLAWDGSLWVVDQANSRVVQYDRSGSEVRSVDVGEAPRLATAGESGIWVTNYLAGSVTLVADGLGYTMGLDQCIGPQGVAEVDGKVWVACTQNSLVVALDVETREVVTTLENVPDADAVVANGDTVYVVGQSGPTVYVIDATTGELRGSHTLADAPRTGENVGAAIVGDQLVVTHPDVRTIYSLALP